MSWRDGEWIDDGSDFMEIRDWCPECDPEGVNGPWNMRYCNLHYPSRDGACDVGVDQSNFLSGSGEAGGFENSTFCQLFHRDNPPVA